VNRTPPLRRALYLAVLTAAVGGIFARRWLYLLSRPGKLRSWLEKKARRFAP
jgi:hypothetical protein